MSVLTTASGKSLWFGYEYYTEKRVKNIKQINDDEYVANVCGSENNVYEVKINIDHLRKSSCNCPHAKGRRVICKHIVALFFTLFPKEAKEYIKLVEENEKEIEEREERRYNDIVKYVKSLSKAELQNALINYIVDDERW